MNRLLSLLNLQLIRTKKVPRDFMIKYQTYLQNCKKNQRGYKVYRNFHYDDGNHPQTFIDFQCSFATSILNKIKPNSILDIGSYRHYVLGLLANLRVTTLDIRERESEIDNETIVTCDAKRLKFKDNSFDVVLSLCALEHFGLGRYGDEFDLDADIKAFKEMVRVLKPGGNLVFTTTISKLHPSISFNAHRIYNYHVINDLCEGLRFNKEKFYSKQGNKPCSLDQVTDEENKWDVYCGCWEKL